ncbi:serine/threonine-protein kinase pim-2-like [Nerophis lumbriciformis]|uniref:serine/threonine-protein kinase pim-2-like n=1 Tax=Nerophis lumbriciformis TaxID=546530 RepID=UPI002ADF7D96|nr:serine/threonine-protein kinase pim-2-like [Nerophis lumbriciformis]
MNVDRFHTLPFLAPNIHPGPDNMDVATFMESCGLRKAESSKAYRNGALLTKRLYGAIPHVAEVKQPATETAVPPKEGVHTKPQEYKVAQMTVAVPPVKRSRRKVTIKQEEQKAEAVESSVKVSLSKRSKRKASTKAGSLLKEQGVHEVSVKTGPAKRAKRNTKAEALAKDPKIETSELYAKALLAEVLHSKYSAKPEVAPKKPQVEVSEASLKAVLAKLTNTRKTSTKLEAKKPAQTRKTPRKVVRETVTLAPCSCCPATLQQADNTRTTFVLKYLQLEKLGEGGFGSVYAGYRKSDGFPVAIKYIPIEKVESVSLYINGKVQKVPLEALLMLQASSLRNRDGTSSVVLLLDTYDLQQELVLVMERPAPSVDLFTYRTKYKLGPLEEYETKNILKQLVDTAIKMHAVNVFHRDLKQRNILLQATFSLPLVRVIDFGCSCFVSDEPYQEYAGTLRYAPPEYVFKRPYKAGPATVWQLGALLFELLDGTERFDTLMFLIKGLRLNRVLSQDCKDFLWICLTSDMEQRATLEQLQCHSWLL